MQSTSIHSNRIHQSKWMKKKHRFFEDGKCLISHFTSFWMFALRDLCVPVRRSDEFKMWYSCVKWIRFDIKFGRNRSIDFRHFAFSISTSIATTSKLGRLNERINESQRKSFRWIATKTFNTSFAYFSIARMEFWADWHCRCHQTWQSFPSIDKLSTFISSMLRSRVGLSTIAFFASVDRIPLCQRRRRPFLAFSNIVVSLLSISNKSQSTARRHCLMFRSYRINNGYFSLTFLSFASRMILPSTWHWAIILLNY